MSTVFALLGGHLAKRHSASGSTKPRDALPALPSPAPLSTGQTHGTNVGLSNLVHVVMTVKPLKEKKGWRRPAHDRTTRNAAALAETRRRRRSLGQASPVSCLSSASLPAVWFGSCSKPFPAQRSQ